MTRLTRCEGSRKFDPLVVAFSAFQTTADFTRKPAPEPRSAWDRLFDESFKVC